MSKHEIIREDLSPQQVLEIREQEKSRGNHVNIRRIHSSLVEIEIISGEIDEYVELGSVQVLDVYDTKSSRSLMTRS